MVHQSSSVQQRYKLAMSSTVSALSLVIFICHFHFHLQPAARYYTTLWTELAAASVTLVALLSLPRRPVVFSRRNQQPILNESGVSFVDWFMFSWGLHSYSDKIPATLKLLDLPHIVHKQSARVLRDRFGRYSSDQTLWKRLLRVFFKPLIGGWILIALEIIFDLGSSFAMHHFLQQLQRAESPGLNHTDKTWVWAALMPLSMLGKVVCENWQDWISHTKLQMPMISLLQSLVFEKAMRVQANEDSPTEKKHDSRDTAPPLTDAIFDHRHVTVLFPLDGSSLILTYTKVKASLQLSKTATSFH